MVGGVIGVSLRKRFLADLLIKKLINEFLQSAPRFCTKFFFLTGLHPTPQGMKYMA